MKAFILVMYTQMGYGQFDIKFQEFHSEDTCKHGIELIKSFKSSESVTAYCIQK
jgi:hypothetical protein